MLFEKYSWDSPVSKNVSTNILILTLISDFMMGKSPVWILEGN